MIIDSHIHVFSQAVSSYRDRYMNDKEFCLLYNNQKSKIITVKEAKQYAYEVGICQLWSMGFCWNDEIMCSKENDTVISEINNDTLFIPFFSVSSNVDRYVKNKIHRAAENGFKGIGEIVFYNKGLDYKKRRYLRLIFEAAQEENLPVCLHMTEPLGHQYPGKTPTDAAEVYSLINEFPGLKVILAHMGGGIFVYELMPEVKEAFKNVYYDTAAVPYLYDPQIYVRAKEIIGIEKILFGSDYPLLSLDRYEKSIRSSLSNEEAEAILGMNAERFLAQQRNNQG